MNINGVQFLRGCNISCCIFTLFCLAFFSARIEAFSASLTLCSFILNIAFLAADIFIIWWYARILYSKNALAEVPRLYLDGVGWRVLRHHANKSKEAIDDLLELSKEFQEYRSDIEQSLTAGDALRASDLFKQAISQKRQQEWKKYRQTQREQRIATAKASLLSQAKDSNCESTVRHLLENDDWRGAEITIARAKNYILRARKQNGLESKIRQMLSRGNEAEIERLLRDAESKDTQSTALAGLEQRIANLAVPEQPALREQLVSLRELHGRQFRKGYYSLTTAISEAEKTKAEEEAQD